MINRTVLVGRLTRDPELKRTASDAAVASFTLAVNRQFTNSQGEREADFINCVIWRKAAENFCKFTNKGSLVGIDGRIQTSSYDNQQGQRVYRTDVVVENFSLLESRAESKTHGHSNDFQKNNTNNTGNNNCSSDNNSRKNGQSGPGMKSKKPIDPFAGNSKPIDISDDSLPF